MKSWSWILLILATILIKWVSLYPGWVERNYSHGLYPLVSKTQRLLFGWIPFSIGDLFYIFVFLVILFRVFKFFRLLFLRQLTKKYFILALQQAIFIFLFIYVSFNIAWGLNYNREGIARQLGLEVKTYSKEELDALCVKLRERLNYYASLTDTIDRDERLRKRASLFSTAASSYDNADDTLRYLRYSPRSLKPSMVGFLGKYIGFQGYYNPFSGEGQVKSSIPLFMHPFVACHEIAHQVGYAKENEANFVGFLASRYSKSNDFLYSAYFDMYQYSIREMYMTDTLRARQLDSGLHKTVLHDRREYAAYLNKLRNRIAPMMLKMYDGYLRMNNQPKGYRTYNEVVTWLIAYYKKFGIEAI